MRKRFLRALIFIAVATGVAVGGATAAGAVGIHVAATDGIHWE